MSFSKYLENKDRPVVKQAQRKTINESANGVESKLDILIDEIRGLRADINNKLGITNESVQHQHATQMVSPDSTPMPKPAINNGMDLARIGSI